MLPKAKQNLDRIFEFAVLASWEDLMPAPQTGVIHVEYGYSKSGSVDFLQIWSSTNRGHWRLACEYRSTASLQHDRGIHFENGTLSDELRNGLELVLRNQDCFEIPPNFGRKGVLQITQPTAQESAVAFGSVKEVYEQLDSLQVLPA